MFGMLYYLRIISPVISGSRPGGIQGRGLESSGDYHDFHKLQYIKPVIILWPTCPYLLLGQGYKVGGLQNSGIV